MNINELIEQIGGRERLVDIKSRIEMYGHGAGYTADEVELMARALLAVLGQGCLHHWISSEGRTASGWLCSKCGDYDGPPSASAPDALREAVNAIYFTDSSDYFSALWSIVRFLSPETADLLAKDERAAFERVNANLQHAAAPAPGGDGG